MKQKKILMLIKTIITLFLLSSVVFASPSANIVYNETNLGNGSWQYDYIFHNFSTAGESLYSVWFDFAQTSTVTGSPLPTGWDGTVWEGTNNTDYIDSFSTSSALPDYDIAAGSSLGGFSFTIDYRAGDIPYTAYFDTESGSSYISGTTIIVPEPISSSLFIIGGAILGIRRCWKNKKM